MSAIGQITVDSSGRIEIPEIICEKLGLLPGATLIVEQNHDGEIRLRLSDRITETADSREATADNEPELIEQNGALVIRGGGQVDIDKLIEEDREERLNKLVEGLPS